RALLSGLVYRIKRTSATTGGIRIFPGPLKRNGRGTYGTKETVDRSQINYFNCFSLSVTYPKPTEKQKRRKTWHFLPCFLGRRLSCCTSEKVKPALCVYRRNVSRILRYGYG